MIDETREADRVAAIVAVLARFAPGPAILLVCGLAVRRRFSDHTPGGPYDVWAAGECACGPPLYLEYGLAAAAQAIATARPGVWPRGPQPAAGGA